MTSKAAHVVAAYSCKATLLLLLLCAYAANGLVEAPESVHRRASFQLDTKRLSQAMWLDGAVNHGVPSTFACSSLEGAACLYSAPVRSRFAQDLSTALLGGDAVPVDGNGATKMKLVLLKPGEGQGIKELLKSMESTEGPASSSDAAAARNQQAAQKLLEKGGGEVVFEGDPASISDVDSVAQAMLTAMGVPENGRVAGSLKQQLAKMLTEAEFAAKRATKSTAATAAGASSQDADADAGNSAAGAADSSVESSRGDGSNEGQLEQHAEDDTASPDDLGTSISNLLNSIRAVQKHAGTSATGQPDAATHSVADPLPEEPEEPAVQASQQRSAPMSVVKPEAEEAPAVASEVDAEAEAQQQQQQQLQPQPQPARAAADAPQPLHAGHQRRRAAGRGGSQRHGSGKPPPAPAADATHEAAGAADAAVAQDNVYVDDETGEQFVLPDEVLPDGEEKVYVDDRTGNTYVVTEDGEADPSSSGRVGHLSRRLSDNQRWLDGLSDQEYDEYMDNYYDQLDREDAAHEERKKTEGAAV